VVGDVWYREVEVQLVRHFRFSRAGWGIKVIQITVGRKFWEKNY
jgi:hypothetical protein